MHNQLTQDAPPRAVLQRIKLEGAPVQENGTRKYFGAHQGEIYHPMIDKARVAAAAMRVATVPLKGTMTEPPALGPYNAIMEQISKAPGGRGRSCSRSALMVKDAAHNAKAVAPAAAMSPWNDLALTGQSMKERANADPLVTEDMLAETAQSYLKGHNTRDPLVSPLNASLTGLPPIQLHVGLDEILLDDARRYVERARDEQVDAVVHIWEGMMHVFPSNTGKLATADEALALIGRVLSAHLAAHPRALRLEACTAPDAFRGSVS